MQLYTSGMEVPLKPEVETQINRIAAVTGQDAPNFVAELVERYIGEEARFLAGVQRGIDQADRGEFIDEEEMDARFERIILRS